MSAGGISYDMVKPSRKVTYPSVEDWGTNMNILRDPPKSIHTRRINKVTETQEIELMQDASGDRISEMIMVYPRGVNPMVDVQYSNYGTSGGQSRQADGLSSVNSFLSGNPAPGTKLPYRTMNEGAFRPPIFMDFNTVPLSRQSRPWTYAFSNPGMPNFLLESTCLGKDWEKAVKKNVLHTNVRPTTTLKIEKPSEPTYEVRNVISNPIRCSASAGMKAMEWTTQDTIVPQNHINNKYMQIIANTQLGSNKTVQGTLENVEKDLNKYIIDKTLQGNLCSNKSDNIRKTSLDEIADLQISLKDPLNSNVNSNLSRANGEQGYNHKDLEYSKNLPYYQTNTNNNGGTTEINTKSSVTPILNRNAPFSYVQAANIAALGDTEQNNCKSYNLPPRLPISACAGSEVGRPTMKHVDRVNTCPEIMHSNKKKLADKAFESFSERYTY